jgi:hypothetical protein
VIEQHIPLQPSIFPYQRPQYPSDILIDGQERRDPRGVVENSLRIQEIDERPRDC